MEEKQLLIEEILELINKNGSEKTDINPNYLDFFEMEDLISIRDGLLVNSENFQKESNDYLDEIFTKCS
ncbi:MAG: hypothetical protein PHF17_07790 [Arcobacteraceae bacterium]|jgi:hypothetical protein|nr:hypothetical protein [Arcobacteraceae bacterium]